jgi:hypothetical protein
MVGQMRREWLLVCASVVAIGCSNDSSTGGSGSGSAAGESCTSITDCDDGQVCGPDGTCVDVQCNAETPCVSGECINGLCVGGFVDGGTDGGTTDGGTTGGTGPVVDTSACSPCSEEGDCENGLSCRQVGPSKHCTSSCSTNGDCASGWVCFDAAGDKSCVPGWFQCGGCLIEGCPDAAVPWCNASSGQCIAPGAVCGACEMDGECGLGQRCFQKSCVAECPDGTCPANGTCQAVDDVQLCKWQTEGECCFGENCGDVVDPCAACGGVTPHCVNQQCVECLNDTHCGDPAQPSCQGNICTSGDDPGPNCTGATPFYDTVAGECVECLNASHCNGNACTAGKCSTGGDNAECATCVDPYPGCAEFQGQWVCVQCSDDTHCTGLGGICNMSNFTCEGEGGASNPPASGSCQTDGCSAELLCDQGSGLCYDAAGNCDNVTQFCINGGECVNFFDLLGGGGGGLPIPGGGGIPGSCTCTPPAGGLPGQGDCPAGLTCGGFVSLILSGLTGTTTNVCEGGL